MTLVESAFSLEAFKPTFLDDLVRVGAKGDGGYVLNEAAVLHSQYLLSFGINDEWSFEIDFLNRKPNMKAFCFDYSVSKTVFRNKMFNALNETLSLKFAWLVLSLNFAGARRKLSELKHWARTYSGFSHFLAAENVRFYPQGVSNESSARFVTFAEAFQLAAALFEISENSLFVKMDIEQSEFRVLPDLLKLERYINGLVVEFHDLDVLWPTFVDSMRKLKSVFEITHIHGNNFGGLIPNSEVPKVLEISFLKRSLLSEARPKSADVSYPIPQWIVQIIDW